MVKATYAQKHQYNLRASTITGSFGICKGYRVPYNLRPLTCLRNVTSRLTSVSKPRHTPKLSQVTESNKKLSSNSPSWISGTSVRNYLLNDPIIDWLKTHPKTSGYCAPSPVVAKERNLLFDMGNSFEDHVMQQLDSQYPKQTVCLFKKGQSLTPTSVKLTQNAMSDGVPIIQQAPLYNHTDHTFGVADLLVRSDYLNSMFSQPVVDPAQETLSAPMLKKSYHYRVIDIKWTTLALCANGRTIRNSGSIPAYKGQLAIYNAALGLLQGYTPSEAYIMSKSWINMSSQHRGYSCFDLLGVIEFNGFDSHVLEKTQNAIKWVRDVREHGHSWSVSPPTRPELYPNMCNHHDLEYHDAKKRIADNLNELTQIWMVGVKHRRTAHSKGIFSWKDKRCNSKVLGIGGAKIGPVVDSIIKINRNKRGPIISPSIIANNMNDWQHHREDDFYVDFECANGCFDENIDLYNSRAETNLIFMIGIGHEVMGQWKYTVFCADTLDITGERTIVDQFVAYIRRHGKASSRIFHWGNAENSIFKSVNARHSNRWSQKFNKIQWVDFCRIMVEEPIVIHGAKKFNLKEVAKAFKSHGLINTIWANSGPQNGLGVMLFAIEYYKFMASQPNDNAEMDYYKKLYQSVIDYNEVDCKTVWEIVGYLRKNHTKN